MDKGNWTHKGHSTDKGHSMHETHSTDKGHSMHKKHSMDKGDLADKTCLFVRRLLEGVRIYLARMGLMPLEREAESLESLESLGRNNNSLGAL